MTGFRIVIDGDGLQKVQAESGDGGDTLGNVTSAARCGLRDLLSASREDPAFRMGRWHVREIGASFESFPQALVEACPIAVEAGFEGNGGVEGGVWQNDEKHEDALVYLRFRAGTVDLPLHVHEFSDRIILVCSGLGLFHYRPAGSGVRELRSVVVEPGDVIAFSRSLLHTFTAPISDLVLLSFHSPFFALDDPRQFTLPRSVLSGNVSWRPADLVEC